jgi:hypothetical protein
MNEYVHECFDIPEFFSALALLGWEDSAMLFM